jgi:hypothetical protein
VRALSGDPALRAGADTGARLANPLQRANAAFMPRNPAWRSRLLETALLKFDDFLESIVHRLQVGERVR